VGHNNDDTRPKGDPVTYRVFRLSGGEPVDSLEAHVLARAYGAAWRALRFSEPVGPHVLEGLGVVVEFDCVQASERPHAHAARSARASSRKGKPR
jgi:hypothetical protein